VKRQITTGHIHDPGEVMEAKERFILVLRDDFDVPDELTFNADETAIWLTPTASWTMAEKGSPSVAVLGQEDKRCVSALITTSAAGSVLKPTVVWKGTTEQCHVITKEEGVHQTHTENKWVDPVAMMQHICECLLPEISRL